MINNYRVIIFICKSWPASFEICFMIGFDRWDFWVKNLKNFKGFFYRLKCCFHKTVLIHTPISCE